MSEQKFYAHPKTKHIHPNGAVSYGPGGPMDCLGNYAKVQNCPIGESGLRLTAYAVGYADTWFSIPAVTRYRGRRITGYFSMENDGSIVFHVHTSNLQFLPMVTK